MVQQLVIRVEDLQAIVQTLVHRALEARTELPPPGAEDSSFAPRRSEFTFCMGEMGA